MREALAMVLARTAGLLVRALLFAGTVVLGAAMLVMALAGRVFRLPLRIVRWHRAGVEK